MSNTLSKQFKLNLRRKVPWVKGVLSAIVLFAAGFVAYKISQTKLDVSFLVSGTNLSVVDKGEVIQILSLNEEAEWALSEGLCSHSPSFIIDKDVNFDGFNDVALLAATGYGGVNCSYDYYIYNAQYKKLEKSLVLEKLSHPEFSELTNKIINSRYKSAGYWYHEDFTWNGITYESVTRREFPLPLLQNSE